VWKLVGPLVLVHRLVLFFSNAYRFPDSPVHSVAFSVDHIIKEQDKSMNRDEGPTNFHTSMTIY